MLTTCPECRTVFRVGQQQLDDKRGLVRCGICAAVFNAYDTLLPELANPPAQDAESEARAQTDAALDMASYTDAMLATPPAVASDRPLGPAILSVPDGLPDEADATAPTPPPEALPEGLGDTPAKPIEAGPARGPAAEAADAGSADILLTPLLTPAPVSARTWLARLAWGGALLTLTLLLLLQLAYFLRDELAAALPESRPAIERACARLGCALPLARDLTSLRIEASSLESDPEDKSRANLSLSLSNRARQPVAWPHLILVLSDARDLPIAERPFAPSEYLPAQAAGRPGLQPGQEQEVRLELELKGLSAYGYKLEMAYP